MNIKIGDKYKHFDDGKARISRMSEVTITDIVKFKDADPEVKARWGKAVKRCDWLYAKSTDYFIYADEFIYVRCVDNGWFSLGFLTAGRLDIDGKLEKQLNEWYT